MRNFFETSSLRRTRLTFTILFSAVFILCTINAEFVLFRFAISNDQCAWREIPDTDTAFVITDIVPGGVSDVAGLKNGDILFGINGINITSNRNDTTRTYPMLLVNSLPKGSYAEYSIIRNGEFLKLKVRMEKVFSIFYAVNYLFGLCFLITGFIVVLSKPRGKTQRIYAYFTLFVMLICGLMQLNIQNYITTFEKVLYTILFIAGRVLGPVIILNFFFYFPVYRKTKSSIVLLWCVFAAGTLITAAGFLFPAVYNKFIAFMQIDQINLLALIFQNIVFVFIFWGLIIFTHRYYKIVPLNRRITLKPILICSVISYAAYFYTMSINLSNQFTIFIEPQNLLQYSLIMLLPFSFAYSIFKYRLMDTELVIKKSLIYGVITASIASMYVILVLVSGTLLGGITGENSSGAISLIAIIIIAFIFDPLKRFVQDYVDRFFYREKSDYQKIIKEFTRSLPLKNRKDEILDSVADTISSAMHVDKIAVVSFENGTHYSSRNIDAEYCNFNGKYSGLISFLEKTMEPQSISVLKEEGGPDIDKSGFEYISDAGIELTVPMILNNKLVGLINTGKKLSGKNYSQDDLDLLMTVAGQTAIAIENSRLYDKERKFYQIQHELDLASKIQIEWLPKENPVIEGYDIFGVTKPAKKVGGDYFDFIRISSTKTAFCLGDVSGKGLPAALLMANLQAIIRSQVITSYSTAECLKQTNKLLYSRSGDNMFVTLFCVFLDTDNSEIQFTNAGHNYPILLKNSGFYEELSTGDLLLGIEPSTDYNFGYQKLEKNDALLIYSDGITEQPAENGEMFGEQRLRDLFIRFKHKNASEISSEIFNEISNFKSGIEQYDDMTLIIIKKTD